MIGRRNRANLLLLGIALLLGAGVLLLPEPRPAQPPPAVAFERTAVDRITLERLDEGEALQLERRQGSWFVSRPAERPADGARIAQALVALGTRTSSCYPAAEEEPSEFGLEPPQAELWLDDLRIEFGYRAHDGRRYIRAQGRLCLIADVTLPLLVAELADRDPGE